MSERDRDYWARVDEDHYDDGFDPDRPVHVGRPVVAALALAITVAVVVGVIVGVVLALR